MALADDLHLGARWTWVGGKGGVGKTTVAAALAVQLADRGESITLLSTDPAHSLGDAFGFSLGPEPKSHPELPTLHLLEIGAEYERQAFLREHTDSISTLLARGTYLDDADIGRVTGMTVPGMDELAALLRLSRLDRETEGRLMIDTAPTGHTLRLLALPEVALAWLDALGAMQSKHDAIAAAFGGADTADEVTTFLGGLREELEEIGSRLRSATETRFVVVTTSEPVVLAESRRLADRLDTMGIALGGIVANRSAARPDDQSGGAGMVRVPLLSEAPVGLEGLRWFAGQAGTHPTRGAEPSGPAPEVSAEPLDIPAGRQLHFVAGKGGVGKSTVAATLAIRLVREHHRKALLLSVDPAGSLGEVLGFEVGSKPRPAPDMEDLWVQQLDAEGAWQQFREDYAEQVDAVFEGLLGSNLSAEHDRQVMERLLDLAPPGIDELMALMEVVDAKEDAVYDALVVDTAPTGHFLRLVQMPGLALEWCHTLLSLLLKYREVIALGGLAERVLKLSRSLREMGQLMRDGRSWILIVALPEALSVPETRRLIGELRSLEMAPGALLVNRYRAEGDVQAPARLAALLDVAPGLMTAVAPRLDDGPVGIVQLGTFGESWRRVIRPAAG